MPGGRGLEQRRLPRGGADDLRLPLRCTARTGPFGGIRLHGLLGGHVHGVLASGSGPLEQAIDADPGTFRRACLALGAAETAGGDLSFDLPLLPDLPLRLRFWHGDEEFEPRLDLLFDRNTLAFLRYETIWYAAGVLRRRLRETMGL